MKGLYIYYDLNSQTKESVGIIKKVYAQNKYFSDEFGEKCDLLNLPLSKNLSRFQRFFSYLFSSNTFDLSIIENRNYDYVYIRRITPNCKSVIKVLKLLRKYNPKCKIVYEIPTYPYDFEHDTFALKMILFIDKIYRRQLNKYINRIVTLTDDKEIFKCKTLKITNGVDVKNIPITKKQFFDSNHINLIAVAQFSFWHGYERVIEGLYEYYKGSGTVDVNLHLVGNGSEIIKYKKMVADYKLENHVIFHNALYGEKLNEVFDTSDIAICSLACHKKNIYLSSELKSREYLCRGLPIISSTKIDVIPDDFKYVLRVPEDDTPIDISKIIEFSQRIYESSSVGNFESKEYKVKSEIRKFAEQNCDMKIAMKSVVKYFKE